MSSDSPRRDEALPVASWAVLAAAVVLVVGTRLAGTWLTESGVDLHLGNAWPLHGRWAPEETGPGLLAAIAVAGLAVWHAPRLAFALSWRGLLVSSYAAAGTWALALALSEGVSGITRPFLSRHDYLRDVSRVGDLSTFLPTFTDHIVDQPRWATHIGGHPPGAFGTFVLLDRIGLGGPIWAGLLCVAVGAVAAPAVISTVRTLSDETLARRAAPFVVFAPAALWIAVSADAIFAGVSAAGICALAHAARRDDRTGDAQAAAGGLALGMCLFLSYGLTLLAPLALGVVLVRRRIRPLIVGGAAVVAVAAAFAAGGFLWWEGLALTIERVHLGAAWRDRPEPYFWFANLAALAVAVGPAAAAALPLVARDFRAAGGVRAAEGGRAAGGLRAAPGFWVLPAGALVAVAVAIISALSVGEVERIYLPFAVWLLPAAGLLPWRTARLWLAAQTTLAIVVEALLRLLW